MERLFKKYDLTQFSTARNQIYGISILWIMFFHCSNFESSRALFLFKDMGNIGVDIFFLLSGICLYFSFSKNENVLAFFVRRCKRVLFPYLFVALLWYGIKDALIGGDVIGAVKQITFVNFLVKGYRDNWYVFGVMLFYLLYPLLYKWFKRLNHNLLSIIVAELVPLAILIVMQIACPTFYKHTEVATTRVFIFIFGAYLGKFVYEGKSMRFNMPLGAIAFAILLAINFIYFKGKPDLRFYYRVSYAPLSFLFVAEMSYILSRFKIGFLPFFGAITLELYLVHEKILWLLKQIGFFSNVHIKNLVSVALAIVVAYLLAFGEKRVARLFGKKDKAVAAK